MSRSMNFAIYSATLRKTHAHEAMAPETPSEMAVKISSAVAADPNEPHVAVWPFPVIQNGVRPPK